jgi:hypothetical protein
VRVLRIVIGAVGALIGAFGLWLLLTRQDLDQLTDAGVWLVAGVVVHDGVLAVATLVVAAVLLPRLPRAARAPAVVGFVVLGSVTLLAVPVLGRFGARPDNPTLLDRHYGTAWWAFAVVVVVVVAVAAVLRSRTDHDEGGARGASPGGRRRSHRA